MKRRNDLRARNHPAWWAFLVHRVSGLALAIFLPLHFLALAMALREPEEWGRLFACAVIQHAAGRSSEADAALRDLLEVLSIRSEGIRHPGLRVSRRSRR